MSSSPEPDVVLGDDAVARCFWVTSAPEYQRYHDDEWGVAVRGVREVFERLTLEGFQSGLSWLVILRKRENFRRAFADFDPAVVGEYAEPDIERLLADTGIVRNRQKIEAAITNARATLELDTPLDELVWSFAPPPRTAAPVGRAGVPAITAESIALSKELKRRGFRFVGPTTAYAAMQAMGLVNDHIAGCHRAAS
ncbi:DNA-3-methyladenine glycosylase I [Epidermidibacterium keratini]|uniref:DNA-3-methyladenine glycosylase I n=1 Tax=Epidermidibacterium keratini TaxID=1891644 RepID=A0A7L4YK48_9ACTN|nr:DNA-3-methyladenine glycosylase I [Epidermidibacterium keratini]QHB99640.1 DNA-3-methyladenine glycosylase I [Epidermidibacterium keratini]